jgi:hypothetical protein
VTDRLSATSDAGPGGVGRLRAWLEDNELHLLTHRVVAAGVVLTAILLLARELPLVPALGVCAAVGLAQTLWFYVALVLPDRTLSPVDLGWVAFAWVSGLVWWAVFTELLWRHDLLEFTSREAPLGEVTTFFLWHLVDLIPFLDIDHTLRWRMPLGYSESQVGWCVLLYQLFVVLPVIALVRRAWKRSTDDGERGVPPPRID